MESFGVFAWALFCSSVLQSAGVAPSCSLQSETDGIELFDATIFDIIAALNLSQEEERFVEGLIAPFQTIAVAPNRSLQNERDGTELFDDCLIGCYYHNSLHAYSIDKLHIAEQHLPQEEEKFLEGLVPSAEQHISTEENDFVEGLIAPSVAINDFLKTACTNYDITGAEGLLAQVTHLRPDLTDVTCSVKETDDGHMKYGCEGNKRYYEVTRRTDAKGDDVYESSMVSEVNHRAQSFRISDYGKCGAAVLACVASEHAVSYRGGGDNV